MVSSRHDGAPPTEPPHPTMSKYSGWNPYATLEMAQKTVQGFINCYDDEHTYSWVMDIDDVIVGTIGGYDYKDDQIEVGFSVVKGWQGRGLATAALMKVLEYLTKNESIPCVTAWCAAENIGSQRVLEKAGMKLVRIEKDNLVVGVRVYISRQSMNIDGKHNSNYCPRESGKEYKNCCGRG